MAKKYSVVNRFTNEIKVMNRQKKDAEKISKSLGKEWYVLEL